MSRYPNLDRSILEVALAALESQKAELDALIESARRQLGVRPAAAKTKEPAAVAAPATAAPAKRKGRRKRVMSAEARALISAAQRKRWADSKQEKEPAAEVVKPVAAKSKRGGKRTMSPEARKRIAEAQRKRWAAVRKAAK